MYQDCFVVAVVAYVLEEDAATEGRDLQAGDVDVGMEVAPCVCANGVGDQGCEEAIEVEEEEDGQDAADEQLNEEDPVIVNTFPSGRPRTGARESRPIEAIAGIQWLRDDSPGHGCSAVLSDGSGASCCSEAAGAHVEVAEGRRTGLAGQEAPLHIHKTSIGDASGSCSRADERRAAASLASSGFAAGSASLACPLIIGDRLGWWSLGLATPP